jgi:hypothetical protein
VEAETASRALKKKNKREKKKRTATAREIGGVDKTWAEPTMGRLVRASRLPPQYLKFDKDFSKKNYKRMWCQNQS